MESVPDVPPAVSTPAIGVSRYHRPDRDFMIVSRSFARSTLSMRATKVGLYVLSHTDGYVLTQPRIAKAIGVAPRTVQAALEDLEAAGLLVRNDVRNERGHRVGTRMHVSDVPFSDQERADLLESPTAKSATADCATADFARPKKSNSKQESKKQEDQPSGGAAAAAPADPEEVPVAKAKSAKTEQVTLFEVDAPAKPEPAFSAGSLVAAYVASYGRHHGGSRPGGRSLSRVGAEAKSLIADGGWSESELIMAADQLGTTAFAGLETQAMMGRKSTRGPSKIIPHGDVAWSAPMAAQDREVAEDPFMSAWLAEQDTAQVSA